MNTDKLSVFFSLVCFLTYIWVLKGKVIKCWARLTKYYSHDHCTTIMKDYNVTSAIRFLERKWQLTFFFFNLLFIYYVYFWLCWVFVSVWGLSPVAASGGHSSSRCAGLSLSQPLLLWSRGSRRSGSVVVAHGPSCSAACGILPDQGSNPCPLHWQADSQPLRHQGSPQLTFMR